MATPERQQRKALVRIEELAVAEVQAALQQAPPDDSAALAEVIVTVVPIIAGRYGLAAGVLAAQWYEGMREAAEMPGVFEAEPAPLPDIGRYKSLAGWATSPTVSESATPSERQEALLKRDVESLVSGGVQRVIANAHRGTVAQASFADPQARGWARFDGGGDGSCPFCLLLITRGGVYEESTAKFGAHDFCNCLCGPIWKGRAGTQKVDQYVKSARRREDADGNAIGSTEADQERAKQWIEDNL